MVLPHGDIHLLSPCRIDLDLTARRITRDTIPDTTSVLTDNDVRRAFCSIKQELDCLRTQHVTHRKQVKIQPELLHTRPVPLSQSEDSRSSSPALRTSSSLVMQRARNSGQFSSAEINLVQQAFDTAASIAAPRNPPSSAARGFNTKLYPYNGTTEPFDTFIA